MKRSYIDWTDLKKEKPGVSDRKYLVTQSDGTEMDYKVCKWYKAGDKVQLILKPEFEPAAETLNAEQRLLKAIFGGVSKTVTVKQDGFYIITSDFGNEGNKDCVNDLILIAEGSEEESDCYWAELPFVPAGHKHPYDAQDEREKRIKAEKAISDEEFIDSLKEYVKGHEIYRNYLANSEYDGYMDSVGSDAHEMLVQGLVVTSDRQVRIMSTAFAMMFIDLVKTVKNNFGTEELKAASEQWIDSKGKENSLYKAIFEKLYSLLPDMGFYKSQGRAFRMFDEALSAVNILYMPEPEVPCRRYLFEQAHGRLGENMMKRHEGSGLSMNAMCAVITEVFLRLKLRVERYLKLDSIGAPAIIMRNEFREVCDWTAMLYFKNMRPATEDDGKKFKGSNEAPFGGYYDFSHMYGITPEGYSAERSYASERGPVLCDTDGVATIPYEGQDEEGNIVKYHSHMHEWNYDEDRESFWELVEDPEDPDGNLVRGIKYRIISWKNRVLEELDNIDILPDGTYECPDKGVAEDGEEVRYDATEHIWHTGSENFYKRVLVDEGHYQTEEKGKAYKIKGFRKVTV